MNKYSLIVAASLTLLAGSAAFGQGVSGAVISNSYSGNGDTMYYNGTFSLSISGTATNGTYTGGYTGTVPCTVSGSFSTSSVDLTSTLNSDAVALAEAFLAANYPGYSLLTLSVTPTWSAYTSGYPYWTGPAEAPSDSDETTTYGIPWTPATSGGFGGSTYYFCVAGYTYWQTGSWYPTAPGSYTFYVALLPASGFTGDDTDIAPLSGSLETNYVPYTLTVNSGIPIAPSSYDDTTSVGTPWTPAFDGGTDGVEYFCVPDQTPWQTDAWTPTVAGTYPFYVAVQPPEYYATGDDTDIAPLSGSLETNYVEYELTVTD